MTPLVLKGENLSGMLESLLKKEALCGLKLCCRGSSMSPFISDGDTVNITPISKLQRSRIGDIAVAVLPGRLKQITIHRIILIKPDSILLKGDNNSSADGWYPKKNILGIVTKVYKKNYNYLCHSWMNYLIALGSRLGILNRITPFALRLKKQLYNHYAKKRNA